jgi:hypothetical protein
MFNPQPKIKSKKKSKTPTKAQRLRWERIVQLGCCVNNHECWGRVTIHHCGTGGGGRKNHDEVIPLCVAHHTSYEFGIDGRGKFTKKKWQENYNTENYYSNEINLKLEVYSF